MLPNNLSDKNMGFSLILKYAWTFVMCTYRKYSTLLKIFWKEECLSYISYATTAA
jgi:hypothetical protein